MRSIVSSLGGIVALSSRQALGAAVATRCKLGPSLLFHQQRSQQTSAQKCDVVSSSGLNPELIAHLTAAVGGKAAATAAVLQQHGVDEGYAAPMPPDIVLFPQTTEQVSPYISDYVHLFVYHDVFCNCLRAKSEQQRLSATKLYHGQVFHKAAACFHPESFAQMNNHCHALRCKSKLTRSLIGVGSSTLNTLSISQLSQ